MSSNYIVITPVRNEQDNLPATVRSMVSQTVRPAEWVIVDDGSSDRTPEILADACARHEWITMVRRSDRGGRRPGTGVIEAFYDGYARVKTGQWGFLVKLDGDLSFEPDYFERCLRRFAEDAVLGLGGGSVCMQTEEGLKVESQGDPSFHVRGATKIYRRTCWEAMGGLLQAPGWDTLDELKANMLGWKTYSFKDIPVIQLKPTGSADGAWKNWFKNGRANYITGYHPLFMLAKCLKRVFRAPVGVGAVGLLCGFTSGYFQRVPRVADPDLIRYLREQQLNRLVFRPSLWS